MTGTTRFVVCDDKKYTENTRTTKGLTHMQKIRERSRVVFNASCFIVRLFIRLFVCLFVCLFVRPLANGPFAV